MDLDNPVCLCFHVSRRKLENYIRIEKPRRAAQLSECFGAGTGCGWCRPFLRRMFQEQTGALDLADDALDPLGISSDDYAQQRSNYIQEGGGTPPPGSGHPGSSGK